MHKIHLMCLANGACRSDCEREHEHHERGMRALVVRKTHKSLTSTGLVTLREQVMADAIKQGLVSWYGGSGEKPAQYIYANGSVIVVGGMDNPDKVMSSEYDIAFCMEATDFTLDDWEKINSRLRNGRVSFQQLLADCNPQQPSHWLKKRCDDGVTKMLYSRHEDNPRMFGDDGAPTPYGQSYLARLDSLTGVRLQRLRYGRWVAAEGVIFEDWRPDVHLIDRTTLPLDWPRVWGVDFGYTNPFVWQQWAIDPDGRLYLEREIYRTKRLVEDHAKDILAVVRADGGEGAWKFPRPIAIVCDHDAEDRATLERHLGMSTLAADKRVSTGLEAMQIRMRVAGDGLPRLFVCRDSLVSTDQELKQAGKPTRFSEEIEGYVWAPSADGKPVKDEPLKLDDHACLTGDSLVLTDRGEVRIDAVRRGAKVWTRQGWRAVLDSGMTDPSARVAEVRLSSGRTLTATLNHPVWVLDRGWVAIDDLRYGDRLHSWETLMSSGMAESCSVDTRTPRGYRSAGITRRASLTDRRAWAVSTKRSGSQRTARSRRGSTSIMRTSITSTTTSATCDAYPPPSIEPSTRSRGERPAPTEPRRGSHFWNASGLSHLSGIAARKGRLGTVSTPRRHGIHVRLDRTSVSSAKRPTRLATPETRGFARIDASQRGGARPASMMSIGAAFTARRVFESASTPVRSAAPARVLSVDVLPERRPVYNLTVDEVPEFFANGVLVHNCDATRYVVAYRDLATRVGVRFINM